MKNNIRSQNIGLFIPFIISGIITTSTSFRNYLHNDIYKNSVKTTNNSYILLNRYIFT